MVGTRGSLPARSGWKPTMGISKAMIVLLEVFRTSVFGSQINERYSNYGNAQDSAGDQQFPAKDIFG